MKENEAVDLLLDIASIERDIELVDHEPSIINCGRYANITGDERYEDNELSGALVVDGFLDGNLLIAWARVFGIMRRPNEPDNLLRARLLERFALPIRMVNCRCVVIDTTGA